MPRIVDAQHDGSSATRSEGAAGSGETPAREDARDARRRPRIALAHDWLCGMRGGEMVLERIARVAADVGDISALYVMFENGRPHAPAIDGLAKRSALLGRLPGALRLRRWLLPLYPLMVADLSRQLASDHAHEPIDLLISSSSAAVKGIRAPADVPHACYCHSPARYIWSRTADYGGRGGGGLIAALRGLGLRVVRPFWRRWDRGAARGVTLFIANSAHIAGEIDRCYGRPAMVIHPPVRRVFTPRAGQPVRRTAEDCELPEGAPPTGPSARRRSKLRAEPLSTIGGPRRERFWLVVSALEPYKRVDLAIRAARLTGAHLVIAGDGSCRRRLERGAGPLIRFEGRVDDERLRELYQTAAVLLFPQIEDFGIVCAEAQACGLPVAAVRAGGALDIVVDGETGAFATPGDARSLAEAARRAISMSPEACRANGARFSEDRFDAEVRAVILAALARAGPAEVTV